MCKKVILGTLILVGAGVVYANYKKAEIAEYLVKTYVKNKAQSSVDSVTNYFDNLADILTGKEKTSTSNKDKVVSFLEDLEEQLKNLWKK